MSNKLKKDDGPLVIVEYDYNWADEADFNGFQIMSESRYKRLMDRIDEYFKSNKTITLSFGTNEDGDFSKAAIKGGISKKYIPEEHANVIKKYIGGSFGYNLRWEDFVETECDDEDDD